MRVRVAKAGNLARLAVLLLLLAGCHTPTSYILLGVGGTLTYDDVWDEPRLDTGLKRLGLTLSKDLGRDVYYNIYAANATMSVIVDGDVAGGGWSITPFFGSGNFASSFRVPFGGTYRERANATRAAEPLIPTFEAPFDQFAERWERETGWRHEAKTPLRPIVEVFRD